MKTEKICEVLGVEADQVTKYKGVFTYRRGFFYQLGKNAVIIRDSVEKRLVEAGIRYKVVDFGEKWTAFRGGSALKDSSHWYVKFTVEDENA